MECGRRGRMLDKAWINIEFLHERVASRCFTSVSWAVIRDRTKTKLSEVLINIISLPRSSSRRTKMARSYGSYVVATAALRNKIMVWYHTIQPCLVSCLCAERPESELCIGCLTHKNRVADLRIRLSSEYMFLVHLLATLFIIVVSTLLCCRDRLWEAVL